MLKRRLLIFLIVLAAAAVPASALTFTRVTVSTTATLVFTAPASGTARVLVRNPSAVSVYIGDATVTIANGFEIAAGDAVGINLSYGDRLFGIVAAATQVVYTIQGANPQ